MSGTTTREEIETRIRAIYELLQVTDDRNHRDIERLLSWYSDDVVYEVAFLEPPFRCDGKPAVRAFMEQLQGLFQDIEYHVHDVHVDEHAGSAVVEAESERTHAASGKRGRIHYVFVYQFSEGLITAVREYVNPLDVARLPKADIE